MITNTYQALCDDVGAKITKDCCTCDFDCSYWMTSDFRNCEPCKRHYTESVYPPQNAEQRERLLCLALNTYRDMLADINDIEIMTPENLFTASLEWIQIGLKEGVLSKEEVKEALIGR